MTTPMFGFRILIQDNNGGVFETSHSISAHCIGLLL